MKNRFIELLQKSLNAMGEKLTVDGDFGPKTEAALAKYTFAITLNRKPAESPAPEGTNPPWYDEAKKYSGKKETDPAFNSFMSGFWAKIGLPNFKTIIGSAAAWCGLAMSVALIGVGADFAKNGFRAKAWDTYGHEVVWRTNGVPKGAMVRINHSNPINCASASDNHIAQAEGDCTAEDLLKADASIDLYGGNQGNTWKVSTYKASQICAVRWPKDVKDFPLPGKVLKSVKCSSKAPTGESTR